jgi:hypothetical protein
MVFEAWLCLSLEDKMADLDEWASQFGRSRADLAQQWLQPYSSECLAPSDALIPEVALFRSDLALLRPMIELWKK